MEITLIALLLLFPIIDLSLDKHKLKNKSAEYIKTALILWAVTSFLLFCFYQGDLSVKPPFILPAAKWKIYLAIFFFMAFIVYMQYVVFSIYKNNEVRTYILENIKKEDDSLNKEYLIEEKKNIEFVENLPLDIPIAKEFIEIPAQTVNGVTFNSESEPEIYQVVAEVDKEVVFVQNNYQNQTNNKIIEINKKSIDK